MKFQTQTKRNIRHGRSLFVFAIPLFIGLSTFASTSHGHGSADLQDEHKNYDAFVAAMVRTEEQSDTAVFNRYVDDMIISFQNELLVSELIDATLGKESHAAVGGNPALYGEWSATTTWPFAFASAANLPDGRILAWGANNPRSFNGGTFTHAAIWDPASGEFVEANHPSHSLFCGIPVMLEDGRIFVSGGDNGNASSVRGTSTFDYQTQSWTRIQDLAVGRWYNGSVALPNGQVFDALGGPGSIYPEIWSQNTGWTYLNGIDMNAGVLNYPTVTEPKNWLPQLQLAPNGKIFHSGHTPEMHYIDTNGIGSMVPVGISNEWNIANTPSINYDEGKIIQSGGALYETGNPPSSKSQLYDLTAGAPRRTYNSDMLYPRIFHNEVVLPNGEVIAVGGNSGQKFSDVGSQLTPEIWNPVSGSWRPMADLSVPRNYHSVALLMTDGKVWSGGGGLCNCSADHPDSQVFSPPYLYNPDGSPATRPVIVDAPALISYGASFQVTTDSPVSRFTLVRMSSTTHTLNSDMRFLNVPFVNTGIGSYTLTFHTNPNVMVPGYWMLFALNDLGVPSVAKVLKVSTSNAPMITNPNDQTSIHNRPIDLSLQATDPNADPLTFSAAGLPNGLTIDPASGQITGTPDSLGSTRVVVTVTDGTNTASTSFVWNIVTDQTPTASEIFGDAGGKTFSDAVSANEKLIGVRVRHGGWIDGIRGILDTRILPLRGSGIEKLNIISWAPEEYLVRIYGLYGTSIGQISFVTNTGRVFGPFGLAQNGNDVSTFDITVPSGREIIGFTGRASTSLNAIGVIHRVHTDPNQPPIIGAITNQISTVGDDVSFQVTGSDPDGDAMTYSAVGLPDGLAIDPATGLISGSPITAAVYDVIVQTQDARGALSAVNFEWTVNASPIILDPVVTSPQPVNQNVTLSANVGNAINPRFKWSFGDGTPETAYSPNASIEHSYSAPGLYVVRVTIIDDREISSTQTFIQAIHLPHTANRPSQSSNLAASSVNGVNRLWVVNQDNASVTVFDSNTDTKIAEIPVGNMPRSIAVAADGFVWVTNKGDASISVIDPTGLQVQNTIKLPNATQPFGLAFAPDGSAAYVALEAAGKLLKLNPVNGQLQASLDVGPNPRHLTVQGDGGKIFVSRYISRPLPGESTAAVTTNDNAGLHGGEIVEVDATTMNLAGTVVIRHSDKEDTEAAGAGVPNYLASLGLSPDGITAWLPSKQDNIKRGMLRNGNNLNFQNTVRAIASKINLATREENYDARIDFDNSGVAAASVYDQSGSYLFAALETSREVAVVDAYGGRELRRIQVGLAPDGLAISPDGRKLYVNNFMDRTVSVVDLTGLLSRGEWLAQVTATLVSVGNEKLSPQILRGKQLFYDARDLRLAADGYLSCAACHNDGGHDGRVWDLSGFGEGVRNTIDLRGRSGTGHGMLHWSANFDEIQDFEGQIRALAGGSGLMADADFALTQSTLGAPKAGLSSDLDALAAYVSSLNAFANSPYRSASGNLSATAATGKLLFASSGCTQCHGGTHYTDSPSGLAHDVGTIKPASGQRLNGALTGLDTPSLRDIWNTAPYLHDGSASTIEEAISAHNTTALNAMQIAQVARYLKEIGGSEPAAPNKAPIVSLTSPALGDSIQQNSIISMAANAADADGTVIKVEFYAGNTLVGADSTAPYSIDWSVDLPGNHVITAIAYDNYGLKGTSANKTINVMSNVVKGLSARYFNNTTLSGTPVLQRNETVDFSWKSGSPGVAVNNNDFSVRWSGQFTAPTTGTYRFRTTSDDGLRLYIDGELKIDKWTEHAIMSNTTASLNFIAGSKHDIVMEYYERGGTATARLLWRTPQNVSYNVMPLEILSHTAQ